MAHLKIVVKRKFSKKVCNLFLAGIIIIILSVIILCSYNLVAERLCFSTEHFFIEYKDGLLYTDLDVFEIAEIEKQEIKISKIHGRVKKGDKIELLISKLSGELIEIKYLDEIIYRKALTDVIPSIVTMCVVLIPLLGLYSFMLYVVNAKNPSKRIDKIKSKIVS